MPTFHSKAILGYDTRSMRSALVMAVIECLNPFKRQRPFQWHGPIVVSSIAGLGDLFIHLPLISGIVHAARLRGIEISVALRPAHAEIGRLCRWNVLPFDNGLEDFFKNPATFRPSHFAKVIRAARQRPAALWIDLTGSAISALAIKLAGAKRIAARVTRGGRSLVDHVLPHTIGENEYANVHRAAAALGCTPDYEIFDRLRGQPLSDFKGVVVLCLTTICRWRTWPIENFIELVDRFPHVHFVATGMRSEIPAEDQAKLDAFLLYENVESLMDQLSVRDLIKLVAHARAVVTNDTSTAHIGHAFRKPGVVLFGPAGPDKLCPPYGLKPFVDRSCPFHPCVQWRCANQHNWCMRKIQPRAVAAHLADVIAASQRSILSGSAANQSSDPAYEPDWQRQAQLPV